jgi:hypothetical protein
VIEAEDGPMAITVAMQAAPEVALIDTDSLPPGTSGWSIAALARAARRPPTAITVSKCSSGSREAEELRHWGAAE